MVIGVHRSNNNRSWIRLATLPHQKKITNNLKPFYFSSSVQFTLGFRLYIRGAIVFPSAIVKHVLTNKTHFLMLI